MNAMRFNESGASLIELMVMSAVGLTMMLGLMAFMNSQVKAVGFLEDKMSRIALEEELKLHFSNQSKCEQVLKGARLPALQKSRSIVNQLKGSDLVFQNSGNKLKYDRLELKDAVVRNNEIGPSSSSGLAELVFSVRRTREGGGPATLQPIRIPLSLAVNKNSRVESCAAETGEADLLEGCWVRETLKPNGGPLVIGAKGSYSPGGYQLGPTYVKFRNKSYKKSSGFLVAGGRKTNGYSDVPNVKAHFGETVDVMRDRYKTETVSTGGSSNEGLEDRSYLVSSAVVKSARCEENGKWFYY